MTVQLLCHFDGTSGSTTFTDDVGHVLTPSSVTVNISSPKFGTGAGDFSASSAASISAGTSPDFNIPAGPFTLEAQAYFTSAPGGGVAAVMARFNTAAPNLAYFFGMVSGGLSFYYSTTGSNVAAVGLTWTPTLNTWYHLAVDRDASDVVRIYINGVVLTSQTGVIGAFFNSTRQFLLGNDETGNRGFPGRLDEVRVTIGQAQYGGAFTPPTAPFSLARYVDFAGNLGTPSSYGKLKYGLKHYSRIDAFAPAFAADLSLLGFNAVDLAGGLIPSIVLAADFDVHANLIDFSGDLAPQIALGGSLSVDVVLTGLEGSFGFTVVLGASSFVSGPLWASETPVAPPWAPSEPCPPSMWTPTGPCDPVEWEPSELCNG